MFYPPTVDNTWLPENRFSDWWTVPDTTTSPTVTYVTEPTKVRLTLSEVEVLREAARKDEKVRAALEKFRHAIEVEVDFPGPEDGEDKP